MALAVHCPAHSREDAGDREARTHFRRKLDMIKVDAHVDFALSCVDVLAAGSRRTRILYDLPTHQAS